MGVVQNVVIYDDTLPPTRGLLFTIHVRCWLLRLDVIKRSVLCYSEYEVGVTYMSTASTFDSIFFSVHVRLSFIVQQYLHDAMITLSRYFLEWRSRFFPRLYLGIALVQKP